MLQRPSKGLKGLGIKDPLQNLTDSEIATINKTRSIDAKAKEEKDSEANLQATVIRFDRKRNEIGSSATSLAKEVGSLFYAHETCRCRFFKG
jgi:hypothetical protein